jgi:polyphosphate kinase 2 (PPK2 family)
VPRPHTPDLTARLPKKVYERELPRLQGERVRMQEWVRDRRAHGGRVRGPGRGGQGRAIKRGAEYLNPRICRITALPAPSERERTQWCFQRYVAQLPPGGEIVLFDRRWHNRAGVERVTGFATAEECRLSCSSDRCSSSS